MAQSTRLLTAAQACRLLGIGRTSLYLLTRQGKIPKPIHPVAGCARWPEHELVAFVERLAEARDRTAAA